MRTLRPSDHPRFSSPRRNPASRAVISGSSSAKGASTAIRRIWSGCSARAASGHAAAPPMSVMNSRRLMAARSFDHLVGAREHRGRDFKAERLGRDQVHDEIELDQLLDRDVGRLRPAQNLVDKIGGTAKTIREIWSIRHKAASLNVLPKRAHRRQSRAECQGVDAKPIDEQERIGTDIKRLCAALERLDGGRDILRSPDFVRGDFETERAGRSLNLAHLQHGVGIVDVGHDRQVTESGDNLAQKLEALAAVSVPWVDRPVTLPPGRARLATRPVPTGSPAEAKTIGMTDVACLAARTGGVFCVRMTSTLRRMNSAAISAKRSACPSAQWYSIAMVRPSIQPSSRNRCTNGATNWRAAE